MDSTIDTGNFGNSAGGLGGERNARNRLRRSAATAAIALLAMWNTASAVTIFSAGMVVPETISESPAGFGLSGDFLIPDARDGNPTSTDPNVSLGRIWRVPAAGGPPSEFATLQDMRTLGGVFLPDTDTWDANRGKYLVTGFGPPGVDGLPPGTPRDETFLLVAGSDGVFSEFVQFPEARFLTTPIIAPAAFGDGSLAEHVLVTAQSSGILSVSPDGDIGSLVDNSSGYSLFGLAFAPSGFGGIGDQLLASVSNTGEILSVDADGTTSLFTTVELLEDQHGLRQMAFAPAGFFSEIGLDEELLLVSVAHRGQAGGTLGDVVAIDALGNAVASLRVIDELTKFDPRGLLVTSAGDLLVSDTSDPIIMATAADFRPGRFANGIPEPSTFVLLMVALGAVSTVPLRRRG